ncbi:hypothetical protein Defa_12160 [Desulfovibrio sp. TH_2024_36128]|uniref:Uncharacterized protein n=1 Tax=Desulfovibrio falkowii TaxID=3136602 RepID=A0ABQ0E7K8_9BACT
MMQLAFFIGQEQYNGIRVKNAANDTEYMLFQCVFSHDDAGFMVRRAGRVNIWEAHFL